MSKILYILRERDLQRHIYYDDIQLFPTRELALAKLYEKIDKCKKWHHIDAMSEQEYPFFGFQNELCREVRLSGTDYAVIFRVEPIRLEDDEPRPHLKGRND